MDQQLEFQRHQNSTSKENLINFNQYNYINDNEEQLIHQKKGSLKSL